MKAKQYIAVLGLAEDRKPHAARFDAVDGIAVRKAASLMGLRVGLAKGKDAEALMAKLTIGKLFVSGRGLVPLVKADIYEKLIKVLELEPINDSGAAGKDGTVTTVTAIAPAWAELKVGTVCIAPEIDSAEDGYWPAVIVAISKNGAELTLRWRDQPKQPQIKINRSAVALLHPVSTK